MHPNVQKWLDFEYAPQKSQEWLDLRMGMLTASDAASAIGVNKYETPHQLLLKKCGKGGDDGAGAAKIFHTIYEGSVSLVDIEVRYKGSYTANPQFQATATAKFKNLFK